MIVFIFQLIVAIFIIRFHVNAYRLGYNPIVLALNQYTNPFVLPFQTIIKHKRFDFAALLVGLIIALFAGLIIEQKLLQGLSLGLIYLFLITWLEIIFYSMIISIIGSWLQADPRQTIMQVTLSCSNWLLAPIRIILPPIGGLDFSPIVAIIALRFAQKTLMNLLSTIL